MKPIPPIKRIVLGDLGTLRILDEIRQLGREIRDRPDTGLSVQAKWDKRVGALTRAIHILSGEVIPNRFTKKDCSACAGEGIGNDWEGTLEDPSPALCSACGGVGHVLIGRRVNIQRRKN